MLSGLLSAAATHLIAVTRHVQELHSDYIELLKPLADFERRLLNLLHLVTGSNLRS